MRRAESLPRSGRSFARSDLGKLYARSLCQRLAGVRGRVAPDAEGVTSGAFIAKRALRLMRQAWSPEPLPTIGGGTGASSPRCGGRNVWRIYRKACFAFNATGVEPGATGARSTVRKGYGWYICHSPEADK